MYVQTTLILLFRHTNPNCYVNIIEYVKAKVITTTSRFSYYQNISVHATLMTFLPPKYTGRTEGHLWTI